MLMTMSWHLTVWPAMVSVESSLSWVGRFDDDVPPGIDGVGFFAGIAIQGISSGAGDLLCHFDPHQPLTCKIHQWKPPPTQGATAIPGRLRIGRNSSEFRNSS
jgi:hypothetical protein